MPAELITELGVDVSERCSPVKERGPVIAKNDASQNYTSIELGGMAFFLQSTNFAEAPFTRIQAGIPRSITGKECISCLKGSNYPDIMSGCAVKLDRIYQAGELSVTIETTSGPFKTITTSFNETKQNGVSYNAHEDKGMGDITRNGEHWASVMFHPRPNREKEVLYLEYTNQEHIDSLFQKAVKSKQPVSETTRSGVRMYSISCSTNKLSPHHFTKALMVYRTIQLENPVRPAQYQEKEDKFVEIEPETVYLSVLALKIVDDEHEIGDYYRYTTCGKYNMVFIAPLLACIAVILILGIISLYFRADRKLRDKIPYSSRTWFQHVRKQRSADFDTIEEGRMTCIRHNPDEIMVLEECQDPRKTENMCARPKTSPSPYQGHTRDDDHISADFGGREPDNRRYLERQKNPLPSR